MDLTQVTGVWGHGGEGHVACPIGVNLQGLSSEGESEWEKESGLGWGRGSQFGGHGQFPQ